MRPVDLTFCILLGISILVNVFVFRRGHPRLRLPLGLYLAAYVLTTAIGALLIAFWEEDVLAELSETGLMLPPMADPIRFRYWLLLCAPLIVPSIVAGWPFWPWRPRVSVALSRLSSVRVGKFGFVMGAASLMAIVSMQISQAGLWRSPLSVLEFQNEYRLAVQMRYQVFETLGTFWLGITYTGLPAVFQVALFQAMKRRTASWIGIASLVGAVVVLALTATLQKGLMAVFVLSVGLGLFVLGARRSAMIAVVSIFALITLYQQIVVVAWDSWQTVVHIIFRLAVSFPFYVGLYPEVLPFYGVDVTGLLLGRSLSVSSTATVDVFKFMYRVDWIDGSAAAPCHLHAYTEGGIPYALLSLVLMGIFIRTVARWRGLMDMGPMGYAIYMQGLISIYYATQISLIGVLWHSYGLFYAAVALVVIWVSCEVVSPRGPRPVKSWRRSGRRLTWCGLKPDERRSLRWPESR